MITQKLSALCTTASSEVFYTIHHFLKFILIFKHLGFVINQTPECTGCNTVYKGIYHSKITHSLRQEAVC